ncbi:MAG: acylphosphatase [Candidatus Bathyarchaeia archaeon]
MAELSSPLRAYRSRVRGRVQRVWYRRFVLDVAQERGLAGYVVNERDGSVTIFAQGEDEVLKGFLDIIKKPLRGIVVKEVDVDEVDPEPGLSYFEIRFGSIQEEIQEGFGGMEREFRDYRGEFRGFSERTDKNFERLEGRYGEISEKLTLTLETLQAESAETRAELKRAVDNLVRVVEKFIGTVSVKEDK